MKNSVSDDSLRCIKNASKDVFKKYPNIFRPYIKYIYYTIGEGFNNSSYYYAIKDFEVNNILEMIKSIKNDIFIEDKSKFKETIGYIPMSKLKLEMILEDILKMTKEKNEEEKENDFK